MPVLKVLTVNAHKGFNIFNRKFVLNELREAVRQVGAEIVFLQEVLSEHALHAKRHSNWPTATQYEFLADSIWPNFAYGRNAVYPDGDHGNALLSKFPILSHRNFDVTQHGDEQRGLLYCVLWIAPIATRLHVICVHLGLSERHRRAQLQLLCSLIDTSVPATAPLVVAGDFNDWRVKAHQSLNRCAGLHEVFVHADGAAAKTFPSRWPLLRLDRIYVRNAGVHTPVVLPRKPWSHLSDHAPLAAEIQL